MKTLEKLLLGGDAALEFLNIRQDDATPAKRIIEWNGFKIGLQYLPFELRHGVILTAGYGHFQKTKGADGMALDVYVGTNLESPKIYAVAQYIDGEFDEEKIIIGIDDIEEAKEIYLSAMPKEFFGAIRELSLTELKSYRFDAGNIPQTIKTSEEIRRDFAAGILSRTDALRMLGYEGAELTNDSPLPTPLLPSPTKTPPYFWSDGELPEFEGSVYALHHAEGSAIAIGFNSEESAETAFLLQNPLDGYEGIEEVTELINSRTDANRLDANTVIKGNLCRGAGGRFVSCGGSGSGGKATTPERITSKTNIAQLKQIADKLGIEKPKNAHKRESWKEAIKQHPEGESYFTGKAPTSKKPKAKKPDKTNVEKPKTERDIADANDKLVDKANSMTRGNGSSKDLHGSFFGGEIDRLSQASSQLKKIADNDGKWNASDDNQVGFIENLLQHGDKRQTEKGASFAGRKLTDEEVDTKNAIATQSMASAKKLYEKANDSAKDSWAKKLYEDTYSWGEIAGKGKNPESQAIYKDLAERIKQMQKRGELEDFGMDDDRKDSFSYFWSAGELPQTAGNIYAINHAQGGVLAIGFDSEESAVSAFENEFNFDIETSADVTSLISDRFDSLNLDASTKNVKGNLCRDARGRFVSCGNPTTKVESSLSKKRRENKANRAKALQEALQNTDFSNHEQVEKLGKLFAEEYIKPINPSAKERKLLKDKIAIGNKFLKASDEGSAEAGRYLEEFKEIEARWVAESDKRIARQAKQYEDLRNAIKSRHNLTKDELKVFTTTVQYDLGVSTRKRIQQYHKEFLELTGGKSSTSIQKIFYDDPRAYAHESGLLNVGKGARKDTFFHEAGHHIEFESSALKNAAQGFRASKATSNKPRPLAELTGINAYQKDEVALPDKFISPYVGKVYSDGSTEVISMGVEQFHSARSMSRFREQDKRHFEFTVGVLLAR